MADLVEARRIMVPVATILSIVGATAWAVWVLQGEAQNLATRIMRVEYAIESTGKDVQALTLAVDTGVSHAQAIAWIDLFRARLQAVDPKLVPTVPDLPSRTR